MNEKETIAKAIMFNIVSRVGLPFLVYFIRGPLIFYICYKNRTVSEDD
jgi:hypothetical protein